ncbi:MAG TPA: GAF domain-containing protein, partial [Sphingomicrobium sp.]|nr:GAF domain-containing protein [Sphingomicrobium sp.]
MQRLELYRRRAADFIERFRSDAALRESNAKLAAEKKATARYYEAGLKVLQAQSLTEALDIMISGSIDLLGADMGIIQLLDSDGTLLRVAAQQGFTQDTLESFFDLSCAKDTSRGRALHAGKPVVIEDVELDEAYAPFRSVARNAGYRALISAPLVGRHGVVQGIMMLHYRSPHRPSDTDLEHLELYRRRGGDFI